MNSFSRRKTIIGKLGHDLIEIIEQLIANGPSDDGWKEDRAQHLMDVFLCELDSAYVCRLNKSEQGFSEQD